MGEDEKILHPREFVKTEPTYTIGFDIALATHRREVFEWMCDARRHDIYISSPGKEPPTEWLERIWQEDHGDG